jgi:hypothetical protein
MGDERARIIHPDEVVGAVLGGALAARPQGLVLEPPAMPPDVGGLQRIPRARSGIIDLDGGTDQGRLAPSLCGEGRPWGSAVRIREGSQQCVDTGARADTDPAWGRADTILYTDQPHTMARVVLNRSEFLELSVDVIQPSMPVRASVWAIVDFGGGSTSVRRKIRCDYRQDLTLAAAFLQIQVYLGDALGNPINNAPFPDGLKPSPVQVAVQVSRGTRGLPYVSTNFLTDNATQGQLIAAPARLMSVTAHLAAPSVGDLFLQLLDFTNPILPDLGGIPPDAEFALGTAPVPEVNFRFLNPRAFSNGVFFIVSAVSGSIPTVGAAKVHIEVEQMLL